MIGYVVHTEILSTLHASTILIYFKKHIQKCHSNQLGRKILETHSSAPSVPQSSRLRHSTVVPLQMYVLGMQI